MDLSEKELILLDAYRAASQTEKQKVEKILNIHHETDLEELRKQKWSNNCIGGMLMQLLGVGKEEVLSLCSSLNSKQFEMINDELAKRDAASPLKIKEILGVRGENIDTSCYNCKKNITYMKDRSECVACANDEVDAFEPIKETK